LAVAFVLMLVSTRQLHTTYAIFILLTID